MHDQWRQISKRLDQLRWDLLGAVGAGMLLFPGLAFGHGDDDVTAATFIGPMLAFVTVVTVVGLGRLLLRALVKRG